jgi:Tfp pilus assembly protein PilN
MKINLLKKNIAHNENQNRVIIAMVAAVLCCACICFVAVQYLSSQFNNLQEEVAQSETQVAYAYMTSKKADEIIKSGTYIQRNTNLFQSIQNHNHAYVDLYKKVMDYIPAFFRLIEISATPQNQNECLVKMVGIVRSYQEYANLMIAFSRMPNLIKVYRKGFEPKEKYVPGLIKEDQRGTPIQQGGNRIPSEVSLESRMAYEQSAKSEAIPGQSTGETNVVSAFSDESEITVYLLLGQTNMKVPNPYLTLTGSKEGAKK